MLYGILFCSKSLLYKSTLNFVEKLKGGNLSAPKIFKICNFFIFWGARKFPPFNFLTILRGTTKGVLPKKFKWAPSSFSKPLCLMKVPQNSQKMKKRHIFNIWGARNFPPFNFSTKLKILL